MLLPGTPAAALTRARADQLAVKALSPNGSAAVPYQVVFGLPTPLTAGALITEPGPERGQRIRSRRGHSDAFVDYSAHAVRLRHRAWLFWEDLAYPAKFLHPSVALAVDDRSGRVVMRRRMHWWPLINGQDPAFIVHRGPGDAHYRVFSTYTPFIQAPSADFSGPIAHAARVSLTGDCVVMLIDVQHFGADGAAINSFFSSRGATVYGNSDIPARDGPQSDPDGTDLANFVVRIAPHCKDVIIYLNGHGSEESITVGQRQIPHGKGATLHFETQDAEVQPKQIKSIEQQLTKRKILTPIKLLIDGCHAGNFVTQTVAANRPVALSATGTSLGDYTGGNEGGVSDFTKDFLNQAQKVEDAVQADTSGADKGARLIDEAGKNVGNFDRYHVLGLAGTVRQSTLPPISPPGPTSTTTTSTATTTATTTTTVPPPASADPRIVRTATASHGSDRFFSGAMAGPDDMILANSSRAQEFNLNTGLLDTPFGIGGTLTFTGLPGLPAGAQLVALQFVPGTGLFAEFGAPNPTTHVTNIYLAAFDPLGQPVPFGGSGNVLDIAHGATALRPGGLAATASSLVVLGGQGGGVFIDPLTFTGSSLGVQTPVPPAGMSISPSGIVD